MFNIIFLSLVVSSVVFPIIYYIITTSICIDEEDELENCPFGSK